MAEKDYSEYELEIECANCGDKLTVYTDLYDRAESEIREVATCNGCDQKEAKLMAYEQDYGNTRLNQQARAEQARHD